MLTLNFNSHLTKELEVQVDSCKWIGYLDERLTLMYAIPNESKHIAL